MKQNKQHVVIVDGYSTGAFYVDILNEKGIPAVHVTSIVKQKDSEFAQLVKHYYNVNKDKYAAFEDGNMEISSLADRLREYNPIAVIVGAETGVELAGQLAAELGLPGNDPASAKATRDKYLMHQALSEAGVRELKSWLGSELDQLEEWVRENGLPVVVKPTRSAASDGIHICRTLEEVRHAFNTLFGTTTLFGDTVQTVLAQEFAVGDEVVVNSVSYQGQHKVSDLWAYHKFVADGGRSIYDRGELVEDFGELTESTINYAFSVLDALKIELGPSHMEIMLTQNGPVLIECGARPMGASSPHALLKECLGITQLELALEAYLDPQEFLRHFERPYKLHKHFFIKCLISSREGNIESVPGVTLLAGLPSVRSGNFLSCFENDSICRTLDYISSFASIYLCHEDQQVVREDHAIIRSLEEEAENLLVSLAPKDGKEGDRDWFKHIPDEHWLKSDEEAAADTQIIEPLLKHAPGLKILDCPCGTAGVSLGLAREGARITGLDLNPRFIEDARKRFAAKNLPGEFHVKDMRDLDIDSKFDVVLNWFNSIGYFDIETDFDILKRMARALVPGGILILEAPNRVNALANTRAKFDDEGREVVKKWDDLSERMYVPLQVGKGENAMTITAHSYLYSLAQLRLLFRLAGLDLEKVYDETLNPFVDDSKRMILMGRKPAS